MKVEGRNENPVKADKDKSIVNYANLHFLLKHADKFEGISFSKATINLCCLNIMHH